MRKELAKHDGARGTFRATFSRYGTKPAYKGPPIQTALLTDVKFESGKTACDHLWMTVGKQWQELDPPLGSTIIFDARITQYTKGYKGHRDDWDLPPIETDYRLSFPNHFRVAGEIPDPILKLC